LVSCLLAFGQNVKRSDSVTVTADVTKEQLRNEDDCAEKIKLGQNALKTKDLSAAEEYFKQAWRLANEYKYLEQRQPELLRLLGTTYLGMGRHDEAVESFTKLLEFEKPNCGADTDYPASCADAQVDLATALSMKVDLSSALALLESAADKYRRQRELYRAANLGDLYTLIKSSRHEQPPTRPWSSPGQEVCRVHAKP
jgi:tetratricopeptide (TPR) repeat protein